MVPLFDPMNSTVPAPLLKIPELDQFFPIFSVSAPVKVRNDPWEIVKFQFTVSVEGPAIVMLLH